jgi:hypothetical protein
VHAPSLGMAAVKERQIQSVKLLPPSNNPIGIGSPW